MTRSRQHEAFGLVELLTALAIVVLLLGLLFPTLNAARGQSRKIACWNHLRQMGVAAQAYTGGYDEHYPLAYLTEQIDGVRTHRAWDFTTRRHWEGAVAIVRVGPGLLWMGQGDGKVQQCPVFRGASNTAADPYTGYNYNTSYIGRDETVRPVSSATTAQIKNPAETLLFGDGEYGGGANKYMRAPFANPRDASFSDAERYMGVQGFRHLGQSNAAFCDGHVDSFRALYTETDAVSRDHLEHHNATAEVSVGFLSPDNRLYDLD